MFIQIEKPARRWRTSRKLRAGVFAASAPVSGKSRASQASTTDLRKVKRRLGRLEYLDYTALEPEVAHRELGRRVRRQVHRILTDKLDRLTSDQYTDWIARAASTYHALVDKTASRDTSMPVRSALKRYLSCLAAWADGAELARFDHPRLREPDHHTRPLADEHTVPPSPSPVELAWLLQDETVGCQTGLFRDADGSVVLWHTEEDREESPRQHFDRLRVLSFRVGDGGEGECGVTAHAFVYPYLLPGPAFAWRSDGYLQAVDSLYLQPAPPSSSGLLANAATWVLLWLGPQVPAYDVIRELGPFADGYAANVAYACAGRVVAENDEFAADRILRHPLGERQRSYLLQVNVGSHDDSSQLRDLERVSPRVRRAYLRRLHRMRRLLPTRRDPSLSPEGTLELVCEALTSRIDPEWSYANGDVKAFFAARLSPAELEVRLGPGPALPGEEPEALHIATGTRC